MNVRGSASALALAVKELSLEWQRTKPYWRDVKSLEFEHKYLEDLPHLASRAIEVIGEIELLLKKVRSDCE